MLYEITTTSGSKYTTEYSLLLDRLAQWIPCTDADGNRVTIHVTAVEAVQEITEPAPKKAPKKKVETK